MASMIPLSPFSLAWPFVITFLLIHLPYLSHAWTLSHAFTNNDLNDDCSFSLKGRIFDLCPLVSANPVEVDGGMVYSEEGNLRRVYQVSLSGRSSAGKSEKPFSCEEGTWVCMKDQALVISDGISGDDSVRQDRQQIVPLAGRTRPPSVLVDEGINAYVYLHGPNEGDGDPTLNLFLIGGRREGTAAQYASIDFQCSYSDIEEEQNIQFKGEYHGVHSFVWISQHACPVIVKEKPIGIQEVTPKEDAGQEDSQENGGDDLLDPHDTGSRVLRRISIVVLLVGTIAICTAILMTSPSARHWTLEHMRNASYALLPLLHRAGGTLKPLQKPFKSMLPKGVRQFRQGDSRLVRWAQEDMMLDDVDMMVNGNGEQEDDRWDVEQLDEYIPLKISPRWTKGTGKIQSYGTTGIKADGIAEEKRGGYWFSNFLRKD